jgi:hypothetical protein
MKPAVLVTCSAKWTAPARLPWVLRRAGCRVSAFTALDTALASTRFVDRVITAPEAIGDYVDALEAHLANERYAWVVITDDVLLEHLALRRASPVIARYLPLDPTSPWIRTLGSKAAFVAMAEEARLPIAPSRLCAREDEARAAARDLGYPVILKKSISWGGLGVRAAANAREVEEAFAALAREGDEPVVMQKLIAGPVGSSIALFDRGKARCWMSAFKARTFPGPFGPSSARRFMTHPEVEPLLEAFGAASAYRGFAAFDWVLDETTGRLAVIELNARAVPTIHMGRFAGVDFAKAIRAMLTGGEGVQRPPALAPDAPIVAMFPEDFYRAAIEKDRRDEAKIREIRYRDIPWSDVPLLAYHVRTTIKAWRAETAASRARAREDGAA